MEQSFFDYLIYGDDQKGFIATIGHVGGWYVLGGLTGAFALKTLKSAIKGDKGARSSSTAPVSTAIQTQPVQVIRDGQVVATYDGGVQ